MDFLIATMKHPIKKMMVHHSSQTVVYSPNMTNDMACKFVFSEKKIFIYTRGLQASTGRVISPVLTYLDQSLV
jgi:hypothetical protein